MSVYLQWNGGDSYRPSDITEVEEVETVEAAVRLCRERYLNLDRTTPCVSEDAVSYVYLYDPREPDVTDPYPDRAITRGPRGGWAVERI